VRRCSGRTARLACYRCATRSYSEVSESQNSLPQKPGVGRKGCKAAGLSTHCRSSVVAQGVSAKGLEGVSVGVELERSLIELLRIIQYKRPVPETGRDKPGAMGSDIQNFIIIYYYYLFLMCTKKKQKGKKKKNKTEPTH
jgi:hypothetical protein